MSTQIWSNANTKAYLDNTDQTSKTVGSVTAPAFVFDARFGRIIKYTSGTSFIPIDSTNYTYTYNGITYTPITEWQHQDGFTYQEVTTMHPSGETNKFSDWSRQYTPIHYTGWMGVAARLLANVSTNGEYTILMQMAYWANYGGQDLDDLDCDNMRRCIGSTTDTYDTFNDLNWGDGNTTVLSESRSLDSSGNAQRNKPILEANLARDGSTYNTLAWDSQLNYRYAHQVLLNENNPFMGVILTKKYKIGDTIVTPWCYSYTHLNVGQMRAGLQIRHLLKSPSPTFNLYDENGVRRTTGGLYLYDNSGTKYNVSSGYFYDNDGTRYNIL